MNYYVFIKHHVINYFHLRHSVLCVSLLYLDVGDIKIYNYRMRIRKTS